MDKKCALLEQQNYSLYIPGGCPQERGGGVIEMGGGAGGGPPLPDQLGLPQPAPA